MTEADSRTRQEEYDRHLRDVVQGDWAKLENDDPEVMKAMRERLGISDSGPGNAGADAIDGVGEEEEK